MSIRRYKKDNEVPHSVVTKDSLCSNAHCSDARLIKAGSTAFHDQNRSFCCRKCLDLNRIAHREARAAISREESARNRRDFVWRFEFFRDA